MINNAGGNIRSVPLEITAEDMHTLFATNYDSMFYCSQASARQFVAQKTGGCIINFSSVCGLVGWPDTSAIYGSTKAAIINLTEALALEWAPLASVLMLFVLDRYWCQNTKRFHHSSS